MERLNATRATKRIAKRHDYGMKGGGLVVVKIARGAGGGVDCGLWTVDCEMLLMEKAT